MVRGIADAGTPQVDQALQTTSNLQGYTAAPITSTNVATQGIAGADLSAYMSPYTQGVTDVQTQQAKQDYAEQQATRDSGAVSAGAFGGDRRFVQDSLAQRDLNNQLQTIEATGLQDAYNSATGLYETDQARKTATDTSNADRGLQAQISTSDANQKAAQLGLDAAQQAGVLSTTQQTLGLNAANALSAAGAKEEQQTQAGLDLAYSDFENQQNWGNQQLSLYSQLLSGTPVSASTSTSTTSTEDLLSQLLGVAVAGSGVAGLFG